MATNGLINLDVWCIMIAKLNRTEIGIVSTVISLLLLLHLAPASSAMSTPSKKAKTSSSTKPILGYWKIRGLGAAIRYQLVYSDVPFDEEEYEQGDGPDFSRDAWFDAKQKLGLTYPNLPYLKDGDFSLTEHGAIHRYCAKKWCPALLCDDDAELFGRAEMAWGVYLDLKNFVTLKCYYGKLDRKGLADASVPLFAAVAKELRGNKYLVGDRLCCADFGMAELIEMMDFISDGEIYEAHPSLRGYRDRMFGLPKLKEYYEDEERCHKLMFNNKVAKINNSV